ncbi:hypothetical protein BDZ91DRAFT_645926, partial [Kalaharituber pfeilii]
EEQIDKCPPFPGLYRLTNYLSSVKQHNGKEMRNLARYLLASLAPVLKPPSMSAHDPADIKILRASRKLLEIVLLTQQRFHSTTSLHYLKDAITEFHNVKDIFGSRCHFNFPKMHLLSHIEEAIIQHGSMDNWTTDVSEALHGACKDAYRSSN